MKLSEPPGLHVDRKLRSARAVYSHHQAPSKSGGF